MNRTKLGWILVLIGISLLFWIKTLPPMADMIFGVYAYIPLIIGLWILASRFRKWVLKD